MKSADFLPCFSSAVNFFDKLSARQAQWRGSRSGGLPQRVGAATAEPARQQVCNYYVINLTSSPIFCDARSVARD
jgi:hypothetical protein